MSRNRYLVIIGLAVIALWVWQGDRIVQFVSDNSTTADDRGQKQKIEVPLTPDEKSAYIQVLESEFNSKVSVYRGRLRFVNRFDIFGGGEYVPIDLVSVRCHTFLGVSLMAPGGHGADVAPTEMDLIGLLSEGEAEDLRGKVSDASDGGEFMHEVCQLVIDWLEQLATGEQSSSSP